MPVPVRDIVSCTVAWSRICHAAFVGVAALRKESAFIGAVRIEKQLHDFEAGVNEHIRSGRFADVAETVSSRIDGGTSGHSVGFHDCECVVPGVIGGVCNVIWNSNGRAVEPFGPAHDTVVRLIHEFAEITVVGPDQLCSVSSICVAVCGSPVVVVAGIRGHAKSEVL